MKEGQPITPLAEEEIAERPQMLARALNNIRAAEEVILFAPNHEHIMEGCRDGKKEQIVTDPQVVQAMKGGVERIYQDVSVHYSPELAQQIHRSYFPDNYKPPVPYRPKR